MAGMGQDLVLSDVGLVVTFQTALERLSLLSLA